MVPIYICEDESFMLQQIKQYIESYCLIEELDFQVELAAKNSHQLLHHISEHPRQAIYFLDVDLDDHLMNGFELGKRIRAFDPRGFIIYITTHGELMQETFKYRLEALDYILKDEINGIGEQILKCLKEIQGLLKKPQLSKEDVFSVESASRILHVPVTNIQYFETTTKKHVVALMSVDEYVEFYDTLNHLAKQFQGIFFRTHQSYLVNQAHMKSLNKRNKLVVLMDGCTCSVSRNKMKTLQEYFSGKQK